MDDRRTMTLDLCRNEQRQLLLEAGSMVLVLAGPVSLRIQSGYMNELMFGQEFILADEEIQLVEENCWVNLSAKEGGRVVLIPADRISVWQQVGRCLDVFLGKLHKEKTGHLFGRAGNR